MVGLKRILMVVCVACALAASAAWAALPGPVDFGVAVERGDKRTVAKWLEEGLPADFQADRIGTGLMIAAWNGDIEMMALFISHGANPRRAALIAHQGQPARFTQRDQGWLQQIPAR